MSIVQSLCMETITQEPTLAADQPGAMLGLKPDAIKDKLRLGMAALVHDIVFLYQLPTASDDTVVCQRLAGPSDNVPLLANPVDTKLHPRDWAFGRCVRHLDNKEFCTKACGREDPARMP
jgi:hypothetical protein